MPENEKRKVEPVITAAFEQYRKDMIPADADAEFIAGHAVTFFAGAWIVQNAMVHAFDNMTCPQFVTLIQELHEELISRRDETLMREASVSTKN